MFDRELRLNGCASVSYVDSRGADFYEEGTQDGKVVYPIYALIANYEATDNLRAVWTLTNIEVFDFGFLDYYRGNMGGGFGVRLGRINNAEWSIYQFDPCSNGLSTVPQSAYPLKWDRIFHKTDGIQIYGDTRLGDVEISTEFTLGEIRVGDWESEEIGLSFFPGMTSDKYDNSLLKAENKGLHSVFTLKARWKEWEFLYGYQRLGFEMVGDLKAFEESSGYPVSALYGDEVSTDISYHKLGVKYSGPNYRIYSEYSLWDRYVNGNQRYSDYFFLRGEYDVHPKVTLIAGGDLFYNDTRDRDGKIWNERTGLPGYAHYGKSWNVGALVSLTDNLKLSVEYHDVHGLTWLPRRYNDIGNTPENWGFWRAGLFYSF